MKSTLTSFLKLKKTKSSIKNWGIKNLITPLKKFLKELSEILINYTFAFYKVALRPYFGNSCKFYPSCSNYAHEAFKVHKTYKATYLSTLRLLRCHPFSEGGIDPVPKVKEVSHG